MILAMTHVLRVTVESKGNHPLSEKIERLWDLDTVGIEEKEKSVCEKFIEEVRHNERNS